MIKYFFPDKKKSIINTEDSWILKYFKCRTFFWKRYLRLCLSFKYGITLTYGGNIWTWRSTNTLRCNEG